VGNETHRRIRRFARRQTIAFAVTSYNIEANKGNTDIWLIDSDGKNLRALKNSEVNENEPKFSPEASRLLLHAEDKFGYATLTEQMKYN
jgi:Tol biopolymer transport system component